MNDLSVQMEQSTTARINPTFTAGENAVVQKCRIHIQVLPWEILIMIFSFLSKYEHFISALVCKNWYNTLKDMRERRKEPRFLTSIERVFATYNLAVWANSFFIDSVTHADPTYINHFAPNNWWKSFAAGGNIKICQRLVRSNYFLSPQNRRILVCILAYNGHFEMVRWLYDNRAALQAAMRRFMPIEDIDCIGEYATASGNIPFLMWLQSIGCNFTSAAYDNAIHHKHYNVIKWLQSIMCPPDLFTLNVAVCDNDILLVKYLVGCEFSLTENSVLEAIKNENLEMVKTLCEFIANMPDATRITLPLVCEEAAAKGSLPILSYLREQGCPWNANTFAGGAESGSLPILSYLRENGCPFDNRSQTAAVEQGHFHVTQWLTELGCPFSVDTFSKACEFDNMEVANYLFQRGCPIDTNATRNAAMNGHINILRFLFENFDIDDLMIEEDLPIYAVLGGNIEVVEYLKALILPPNIELDWDDHLSDTAAHKGYENILRWLQNEGYFATPETLHEALGQEHYHLIPIIYQMGDHITLDHYNTLFLNAPRDTLQWIFNTLPHLQDSMIRNENALRAALNGNLEAMKWLHDRGLVIIPQIFVLAAICGHLPIFDWGRTIGAI